VSVMKDVFGWVFAFIVLSIAFATIVLFVVAASCGGRGDGP